MSSIDERKTLEDIETKIARRYNWREQEKFWEHQARIISWQLITAVAAVAATIGGLIGRLWFGGSIG